MKLIFVAVICILLILLLILIVIGLFKTIQTQNRPEQTEFLKGIVPKNLPNGLYKGNAGGLKTAWQGKRFDASDSSGINVFKEKNDTEEKYPFKTSVGFGVQDKNLTVIKINYSANKEPWWLGYILDEVVEVSPGKYLGKLSVRIIPGLPFSLGFFRLEK